MKICWTNRRGFGPSSFAWFVGKDVALVLGYKNPQEAVRTHVDDEDKRFEMLSVSDSQNGNLIKTAVINESGDYLVCGIQTVKEVFGSFDGFSANGEVFCDFVGGSFESGTNVPILGTLVFTIVAPNARISYAQLLGLIRLTDQNRSLFVADIAPPNLVLAHPDDGGDTIQKHRF